MTSISEINWGCRNLTPWWIDNKVWWWEAGPEHLTRTFYIEQSIKEHRTTVTHDFHWWGSAEIPRESVIPSQIFPQHSTKKHSSSYQPCDWLTVTVTFDRSIVLWAGAIKATLELTTMRLHSATIQLFLPAPPYSPTSLVSWMTYHNGLESLSELRRTLCDPLESETQGNSTSHINFFQSCWIFRQLTHFLMWQMVENTDWFEIQISNFTLLSL